SEPSRNQKSGGELTSAVSPPKKLNLPVAPLLSSRSVAAQAAPIIWPYPLAQQRALAALYSLAPPSKERRERQRHAGNASKTAQKIEGLQSGEPKPPKQPAHAGRN